MPYSLLSRFQGCLLGSVLGADWAAQASGIQSDCSHLTGQSVQALIQTPGIPLSFSRLSHSNLTTNGTAPELAPGSWAIATLPLMLFFHDDALKQQQALIQAMQPWRAESNTQDSLLALGYAIAQACKQQINPATLLSEIRAYLELSVAPDPNQPAQTMSWVASTQTLLAEASDFHTAITTVQQWHRQPNLAGAIALAFYCFLRTPEAWLLSVQQAGQMGYSPSLVAALTGALSGAYNSAIGVPISWLTAYEHNQAAATEPIITAATIRQWGSQLLASWSGSYDVAATAQLTAAVAAPQVIRPR